MEKLDTGLEALSLMASPLSECSEVLRMLPGKRGNHYSYLTVRATIMANLKRYSHWCGGGMAVINPFVLKVGCIGLTPWIRLKVSSSRWKSCLSPLMGPRTCDLGNNLLL